MLDLSKNESIPSDQLNDKKLILRNTLESESLKDLYEFIESDCQNMLDSPQDACTKRFVISGIEYFLQASPQYEVMKFFQALKLLARSSHTIFIVSLDPKMLGKGGHSISGMIESYFDFVFEIASIHSNLLL